MLSVEIYQNITQNFYICDESKFMFASLPFHAEYLKLIWILLKLNTDVCSRYWLLWADLGLQKVFLVSGPQVQRLSLLQPLSNVVIIFR